MHKHMDSSGKRGAVHILMHSPAASPVTHKPHSRDCYHPISNDDSDEKEYRI